MAAYKYYAAENARHFVAKAAKITRTQVVELANKMSEHFGRKPLPVYFSDYMDVTGTQPAQPPQSKRFKYDHRQGKYITVFRNTRKFQKPDWSWFSHNGFLSFGVRMFDVLTVAHEVSHYLHFEECQARETKYVPHGKDHAAWVDRCVEWAKSTFPEFFAPELRKETFSFTFKKVDGEIFEVAKDPIKAFYDSLPERLTCPCCNATLPKMNFGVRVMKRDADNNPTVIRRQSYCRACR